MLSYLDIFLFLFIVYVSDRVEMSHVSIYGRLFHKYLRIPYGSISEAGELGLYVSMLEKSIENNLFCMHESWSNEHFLAPIYRSIYFGSELGTRQSVHRGSEQLFLRSYFIRRIIYLPNISNYLVAKGAEKYISPLHFLRHYIFEEWRINITLRIFLYTSSKPI